MKVIRTAAIATLLSLGGLAHALAAYAGNVTLTGGGTCSEISGTYPTRVALVTSPTETVYYLTFIVPPPSPAAPQYLVTTLVQDSGEPNESFAADPELFGTLDELSGSWSGSITYNSNQLTVGSGITLRPNGSTTGTPLTATFGFNGGTRSLSYTGILFNED